MILTILKPFLRRADLVKFAKSAPDVELAKLDRNTIDLEIDQVKASLTRTYRRRKAYSINNIKKLRT